MFWQNRSRLRSLLLYLCYVFRAPVNSLVFLFWRNAFRADKTVMVDWALFFLSIYLFLLLSDVCRAFAVCNAIVLVNVERGVRVRLGLNRLLYQFYSGLILIALPSLFFFSFLLLLSVFCCGFFGSCPTDVIYIYDSLCTRYGVDLLFILEAFPDRRRLDVKGLKVCSNTHVK